ncbi:hypothetical protein TRFO_16678 [Tritrichomonas foetus]|uniref:Uncharacterized protein n=1 Tax=Tritrichomonas foetus TaxID=1144522 RepID=A0A1J4KPR6_9EUKA|nr:hypothetical protein TRFO_16678 [Tritrichomonas foetus]|eukprot:OHT13235.1 hypothetical protein TRFO_16678 [Tritrichomonas foetus]
MNSSQNENEPNAINVSQQSISNTKDADELVNMLQQKNSDLKAEKLYLQKESLIDSIEQLIITQNKMRAQLNMSENDFQDDLHQYTVDQLEVFKKKIEKENSGLSKKFGSTNQTVSDELNDEISRNQSLKKELNQVKNSHQNDYAAALNELQMENQRLAQELEKAKSKQKRSHHHERNHPQQEYEEMQQKDNRHKHRSSRHQQQSQQQQQQQQFQQQQQQRKGHHQQNKQRMNHNASNNEQQFNRPADPNKVHLAGQLMAENALLRNTLGLDQLNYHSAESFNESDIDVIIAQLLDHNKIMREQAAQQSNMQAQNQNISSGSKRAKTTKAVNRYQQYLDLQGSYEGCTFWVPLDAKKQQEQQEYYNDMQMRLPVAVERKPKKKKGCNKCENAILMMARVPLYPPDSSLITENSDEHQLVESWIVTSLNKRVRVENLAKSLFFYRVIENERTMHNIHLVVVVTNESQNYLMNGVNEPILVADHFKYVQKALGQAGSAQILICVYDQGNQATNYCEHTTLPNLSEMKSMNQSFDSLRFRYQGEEAIMTLDPSRLVPLYSANISVNE